MPKSKDAIRRMMREMTAFQAELIPMANQNGSGKKR